MLDGTRIMNRANPGACGPDQSKQGFNLAVNQRVIFVVSVVFGLLLLSSCQPKRVKTTATPPPPTVSPPAPEKPPVQSAENKRTKDLLKKSAALLKQSSFGQQGSVPDAVLNRTRCFFLFTAQEQSGLSSCRSETDPTKWNAPRLVFFDARPPATTSMLFILSDRATAALNTGSIDLSRYSVEPGKTVSEAPLLTDGQLAFDALSYSLQQDRVTGSATPFRHMKLSSAAKPNSSETLEFLEWLSSYFNTITPTGIIIHHSAMLPASRRVPTDVKEIDRFHAGRGFDIECFGHEYHVAYHFLIMPDGQIKAGRPERCQGAHARAYNSYIGISMVGDFSSKESSQGPTQQQLKSLVQLTRGLQQRYKIPVQRILRHSDVASTECPGDRFEFKAFLLSLVNTSAGAP